MHTGKNGLFSFYIHTHSTLNFLQNTTIDERLKFHSFVVKSSKRSASRKWFFLDASFLCILLSYFGKTCTLIHKTLFYLWHHRIRENTTTENTKSMKQNEISQKHKHKLTNTINTNDSNILALIWPINSGKNYFTKNHSLHACLSLHWLNFN